MAENTQLSRRGADEAILNARVTVNRKTATLGIDVNDSDLVTLDNQPISLKHLQPKTVLLNKPIGYVCSRRGQGSPTVYDLIPDYLHNLNIAGRLDKDSSGLVVLTSDGDLLNELTHPSKGKTKKYLIETNRTLNNDELIKLTIGVDIGEPRLSKFKTIKSLDNNKYVVILEEGRNRQIRRAIDGLGAKVTRLERRKIANYELGDIKPGNYREL